MRERRGRSPHPLWSHVQIQLVQYRQNSVRAATAERAPCPVRLLRRQTDKYLNQKKTLQVCTANFYRELALEGTFPFSMARNAIAHGELDAMSNSDYSHISVPRSSDHNALEIQHSSSDFEITSVRSRNISNASSVALRHPTPDLQSLQGAYIGNIERLEQSAERLSISSDIGEELRKLKIEQRKSESRRSSLNPHIEEDQIPSPAVRQFPYGQGSHASNSLIDMNHFARAGGFSPSGYFASPMGSLHSGSWSQQNSVKGRSISQASRLTGVLEPGNGSKPNDTHESNIVLPAVAPLKLLPKVLRVTNDEESSVENGNNTNDPELVQSRLQERKNSVSELAEIAGASNLSHQTNQLFEDFDGVHITAHPDEPLSRLDTARSRTPSNPLMPANRPRPKSYLDPRPKSYIEPPPDEDMVYYPAPVPMILNLPQKLSKLPPIAQKDKRRSQILGALPTDARKSAAWLPNVLEGHDEGSEDAENSRSPQKDVGKRRSTVDVPPQLRASVFFDYPAAQQNVELIGDSAVATLDSILDASAYAPVSAFTDHPIVGHAGPEVYGKTAAGARESMMSTEKLEPKRRRNSLNLLRRNSSSNMLDDSKRRNSSLLSLGNFGRRKSNAPELEIDDSRNEAEAASMHPEDSPLTEEHGGETYDHSGERPDDLAEFHDAQEDFDNDLQDDPDNFNGQPTTLLAELQLRKQQLKTRTRTAAIAYPNGMHSTLLELDAVAQVEKRSRQQKHINLAWEAPGTHHPTTGNDDDEDVPLGMLFPNRQANARARYDEDRPIGLIARRDMEDNEPLSRRRARLRGEETLPREAELARRMSTYTLNLPGFATESQAGGDAVPEEEGETLAQRLKRLKNANSPAAAQRSISGDFTSEVMSLLGVPTPPTENALVRPTDNGEEEEEETLGQRRKRLQAERDAANNKAARPGMNSRRTSMADLLQAHPAAGASRTVSREELPRKTRNTAWAMDVNKRASEGNLALGAGSGFGLDGGNGLGLGMGTNGNYARTNGGYGPLGAAATAAHNQGARTVPHPMVSGGMVGMEKGQRDMIERWRTSVLH